MPEFEIIKPLLGGFLIGLSASLLMLANGRIAGCSGILEGILIPKVNDFSWKSTFIIGLLFGGFIMFKLSPEQFAIHINRSLTVIGLGGVCVGIGTHIGCGCTSGHGVCGISRLSPRSLVAVPTFIFSGAVTVWIMNHFFG